MNTKIFLLIALSVSTVHVHTLLPGQDEVDQTATDELETSIPNHTSHSDDELETVTQESAANPTDTTYYQVNADPFNLQATQPTSPTAPKAPPTLRAALLQKYRNNTAQRFITIDGIKIGYGKYTEIFLEAIELGSSDLVETLLQKINFSTAMYKAIRLALCKNNTEIIRILYKDKPGYFTLATGIYLDDLTIAHATVTESDANKWVCFDPKCSAYAKTSCSDLCPPLYKVKSLKMAKLLVDNGAMVDMQAVRVARENKYYDVADYLSARAKKHTVVNLTKKRIDEPAQDDCCALL